VADGKLQPFDGDLDDYKDWLFKTKLAARNDAAAAAPLPAASQPVGRRSAGGPQGTEAPGS
jgi:ATP-binding cassette subfamily F protein 3